ncbi:MULTISPECIES: MarR family winged helix-turn-helix transcriptional regulator [unclassified Streptomyces]|uniref:MarR family winged helix-turn-helix transcriptional regulator n=1 Tax=unclassified Streptomyces TaxID=2593676 RepID=UPI003D8B1E50
MNTNTDDDLGTSPVVDFGMALKRAQHLLSQRIDGVLRPLDLNLGLWVVLREVSRQPGASASELARASFHTPQTLSGLLRRLQERGLVERSTGRGRIVENHLTADGHHALTAATERAEEVMATALAVFGPADRASFERLTADFAGALAHDQPPSRTPSACDSTSAGLARAWLGRAAR